MDAGLANLFSSPQGKKSLGTRIIGTNVLVYDEVTSTNDLAHLLAKDNKPQGTAVFAHGQTQGRGRLGNTWASPYGKGIYVSFILRPAMSAHETPRITLMAALAVATALKEIHIKNVSIKWPNDVYAGDKKIAGILTEMSLEADAVSYVIVGLGVNVNTCVHELPPGSVSVKELLHKEFDIADLSHIIMKSLDDYYGRLMEGQFAEMIKKIKEFSGLILGERVRVSWETNELEGYAVDFDENGGLIVRLDNGFLKCIHAGHLTKVRG